MELVASRFLPYLGPMDSIAPEGLQARIRELLTLLNHNLFEKEKVMGLTLLSALAGESIFLLGPPGVAKSMIARRLKYAFKDAQAFEYLMGKFSTPDEVFGPVSISKLKEQDKYERLTEYYLPGAHIVFLDEIWKASPAIQNSLLTVLNEKIYRNGEQELKVDIRGLISASNELPLEGEGLEALWDRFLIRLLVRNIEDDRLFNKMVSLPANQPISNPVEESLKITGAEYYQWLLGMDQVEVPNHILGLIGHIRRSIEQRNQSIPPEQHLYVSDRRWRKIVKLLRTSAFLNGHTAVDVMDCMLIADCIWNSNDQIEECLALVTGSVAAYGYKRMISTFAIQEELDMIRQEVEQQTRIVKYELVERAIVHKDPVQNTYVRINNFWGDDPAFVRLSDFQKLNETQEQFVPIFEQTPKAYRPFQTLALRKVAPFSLLGKNKELKVESEEVEEKRIIQRQAPPEVQQIWNRRLQQLTVRCDADLQALEAQKIYNQQTLKHHLFVAYAHAPAVSQSLRATMDEVYQMKLEIGKTQHSYESVDEGS